MKGLAAPDGRFTSFYQRYGLALGARNHTELKARAEEVLADRHSAAQRLAKAYRGLYTVLPDPVAPIAAEIENAAFSGDERKTVSFAT